MNCKHLLTTATLMIFGLARADQKFYMPCGKDGAFSDGSIGGPVTGISTVKCGAKCDADPNCRSFTYNKNSKQCQLSSKIVDSCNDVSQKQGAMYYQVSKSNAQNVSLQNYFKLASFQGCLRSFVSVPIAIHSFCQIGPSLS